MLPPTVSHATTDPTKTSGVCQTNGSAEIVAILNNTAVQWDLELFNDQGVSLGTFGPYSSGGSATVSNLAEGTYEYSVTDSEGCITFNTFVLQCVETEAGGCEEPTTTLDTVNPTTTGGCRNGRAEVTVTLNPTGVGTASTWGVIWYQIDLLGNETILWADTNQYADGDTSANVGDFVDIFDNTAYTYKYYIFTDIDSCNFNYTFDLTCDPVAESYDCIDGACIDPGTGLGQYATLADCVADHCGVPISGCTDPAATNYDPTATSDDGSCCYISGCTDVFACNYNPAACDDDGSCTYAVFGCTAPGADNYYPGATADDGSCEFNNCPDTSLGFNVNGTTLGASGVIYNTPSGITPNSCADIEAYQIALQSATQCTVGSPLDGFTYCQFISGSAEMNEVITFGCTGTTSVLTPIIYWDLGPSTALAWDATANSGAGGWRPIWTGPISATPPGFTYVDTSCCATPMPTPTPLQSPPPQPTPSTPPTAPTPNQTPTQSTPPPPPTSGSSY